MEAILEIIAEMILQILLEGLAELGWHGSKEAFWNKRIHNPWLAGICMLTLGAFVGLISLVIFDEHLIKDSALRVINLIITPLIAGLVMGLIGRWRRRHERNTIRLESFVYGYLFALAVGLIRFAFCD